MLSYGNLNGMGRAKTNSINGAWRRGEYRFQMHDDIAAMVVRARKELGWKQFALADEAGVNERTIQRLERGGPSSR